MTFALALAAFFALLVGHVIADYPLQGDFLARGKNVSAPIPGVPWRTILASHALIHAGFVWAVMAAFVALAGLPLKNAITFGMCIGAVEFVLHGAIDHLKCSGRLGEGEGEDAFNRDQLVHACCKAGYVAGAVLAFALFA